MKTTFIYFLQDPENPNKGYVGKSDRRFSKIEDAVFARALAIANQ